MRTRLPLVLLLAALSFVSGCITSDTLLKVKPNGSGTMEMTFLVNTQLFKELGTMMGGEVTSSSKSSMPSPEKMAEEVKKLKGVRLVSQVPIKRDGLEGTKLVLAFDDINTVTVSDELPGKSIKPDAENEVDFALTKLPNGNSLLTVKFPDKPAEKVAMKEDGTPKQNQPRQNQPRQNEAPEKTDPEMLKMIAGFFKDMRMSIAVDVDGTLVKSSSPYVEGNRVTLLDLDFGQALSNPEAFEKLDKVSMGPDTSISEVRVAMEKAGIKGFKVNEPTMTIEFK